MPSCGPLRPQREGRAPERLPVPNPLEIAPLNSDSRYQQVEYVCKSCGHRTFVSDAFPTVKCLKCGAIGKRTVLLDPRLYFSIIEEIKETVSEKYCFHDWRHTQEVVEAVYRIIPHCPQLTVRQKRCLLFAALTHDMGYMVTAEDHETESARIAGEIGRAAGYSVKDIALIQSLIMTTVITYKPKTLCEKILRDADLFHLGTNKRLERSRLLRRELANCGKTFTDVEWRRREAVFIANHHFNLQFISQYKRAMSVRNANLSTLNICVGRIARFANNKTTEESMNEEQKPAEAEKSAERSVEEKQDAEGQGIDRVYCPKCGYTGYGSWGSYCPKWGCTGRLVRI